MADTAEHTPPCGRPETAGASDRRTMEDRLGPVHMQATRDGITRWFRREQLAGKFAGMTYEEWLHDKLAKLGMTELTDEAVLHIAGETSGLFRLFFWTSPPPPEDTQQSPAQ